MKRRVLSLVLCMAMLCIVLSGCGNSNNNDMKADDTENIEIVIETEEIETEEETTDYGEYIAEYIKYIRNAYSYGYKTASYSLVDIDDNGVYELIVSVETSDNYVLVYDNGVINETTVSEPIYDTYYLEGRNKLNMSGSYRDEYVVDLYFHIEDGKLVRDTFDEVNGNEKEWTSVSESYSYDELLVLAGDSISDEQFYTVSVNDLSYDLKECLQTGLNYCKALANGEISGEDPSTPMKLAQYCKTNVGGLSMIQATDESIIFTENFCENYGDWEEIYNIYLNSYKDSSSYMMVDIIADNFNGTLTYKEGTDQVIKVLVTIGSSKHNVIGRYFIVEFTKEAGNNDVWLINGIRKISLTDGFASSQEGFDFYVKEELNPLLINEDGLVRKESVGEWYTFVKNYLVANGYVLENYLFYDLNEDGKDEMVVSTTANIVLVFSKDSNDSIVTTTVDIRNGKISDGLYISGSIFALEKHGIVLVLMCSENDGTMFGKNTSYIYKFDGVGVTLLEEYDYGMAYYEGCEGVDISLSGRILEEIKEY